MAHPIQIILTRQLAGYLSVPIFLVDPKGNLLFYNEPAETILGRRFEETGAMAAEEWSSAFSPLDEERQPLPPEKVPLRICLTTQRPVCRRLFIRGLDGVLRTSSSLMGSVVKESRTAACFKHSSTTSVALSDGALSSWPWERRWRADQAGYC
jgi:PAS domain-containing protein